MTPIESDADIECIARGLIDRTLPKSAWTHAAHFAAALWLVRRDGNQARTTMPGLIRAYNEATGVANTDHSGYHETITFASLRVAEHWLALMPSAGLSHVLAALLAGPAGRSDWILAYWSRALLFSVPARSTWVEPDICPLDLMHGPTSSQAPR